jgi:hypothetical protein
VFDCFDVVDMVDGYETIYRRMLAQACSGSPLEPFRAGRVAAP